MAKSTEKVCPVCEYLQPIENFRFRYFRKVGRRKKRVTGTRRKCAACHAARRKRPRDAEHLLATYGLTMAAYEKMLSDQGGRCGNPGCRADNPQWKGDWHVDHDHATGAVRGILCRPCNLALGLLKDDPRRLAGLVVYLDPPAAGRQETPQ
jgi:hypothetical protein